MITNDDRGYMFHHASTLYDDMDVAEHGFTAELKEFMSDFWFRKVDIDIQGIISVRKLDDFFKELHFDFYNNFIGINLWSSSRIGGAFFRSDRVSQYYLIKNLKSVDVERKKFPFTKHLKGENYTFIIECNYYNKTSDICSYILNGKTESYMVVSQNKYPERNIVKIQDIIVSNMSSLYNQYGSYTRMFKMINSLYSQDVIYICHLIDGEIYVFWREPPL